MTPSFDRLSIGMYYILISENGYMLYVIKGELLLIYADVVWLLNVCFDVLLLWLTALMLKRKIVVWRMLMASLFGSLLVLLLLSPFSFYASHPIVKLFVSFFMVVIAFGFHRFRFFFENLLAFYFSTFVMGGGMLAFHYFFQREITINHSVFATYSTGFGHPISWLFVLISFPILWMLSRAQMAAIREKKLRFEQIIDVTVTFFEETIHLKGLIDSGNQLLDPLTKTPVMIVELNAVKHILPQSIIQMMIRRNDFLSQHDDLWLPRIRLIPYRAIGKEQQFLVAVKPDLVQLFYENEWIKVKKVLVGLNTMSLSTDGEYNCIVHPHLIMTKAS
jgi:stage II sporulation protein GA (sporulation sigma-E factor processing peptidase)